MPKSQDAIAAELAAAGCKAIREDHCAELSRLLLDDEHIIDSLICSSVDDGFATVQHLVVTSDRIVHLYQGVKTSWRGAATGFDPVRAEYVMWKHIASISIFDRELTINSGARGIGGFRFLTGGDCCFDGVPGAVPEELRALGERTRADLDRLHTSVVSKPAVDNMLIDKLERLTRLRESGALDDEEFRAAKRKLLLN
jgi:hypothetical protein